jgi:quinoprotein glucose dehydrogenase
MRSNVLRTVLALSGIAASSALAAPAGDWPSFGRDPGSQRYSPLTQITPGNVGGLQVAWTYHMNPAHDAAKPTSGRAPASETTPLVVDGIMYLSTPYARVAALDAETGKEIWTYQLPSGEQTPLRGIGYWPGDAKNAAEIVFGTSKGNIIALSARTGLPMEGFGNHGILDTKTADIMNGFPDAVYRYAAAPTIYKNLIIIGSSVGEIPLGPAGDVRAWDVRTGKLTWQFHAVPRPGEPGHETWQGDDWKRRSGTNVWNVVTVDQKRGVVYMPFGAPALDRYGGDRHGANLFGNALVAADANTGRYLWHYQINHHEIWDWDISAPPTLLEVRKGGKTIPAISAINKSGLLFILDRRTGKPIYNVTEQAAPPSSVEGEEAWPTQPVPDRPAPLARMTFALDEVTNITPELHDFCQAWIARENLRPSTRFEPIHSDRPMIRFPGGEGGVEWAGGAFDPKLGYYIINTNNLGYVEKLIKDADGKWNFSSAHFWDKGHNPCQPPPWGQLTAVNVNTGEIAWQIPLGITDSLPEGKQNTGRPNNGGASLTATGIAFIGGTDDARFRAFDSRTGKLLWSTKLDYAATASPTIYQGKSGKEFVAVTATGGTPIGAPGGGDSLVAFALPH